MKKTLLSGLLLLPLSLFAQSKEEDKAFKDSYMDACIKSATEDGTVSEKLAKEYCTCTLERLLKKYTYTQMAEIGESMDEAQMNKLMEETIPCQEELLRKLKKGK